MKMVELELRPDRRRLRQFGWIALVAFGALASWVVWKGSLFGFDLGASGPRVAVFLGGLGGASGLFSLVWPAGNRLLYVLLTLVAYPIGTVVSYTLMAVIFYVFLTPLGLWFRVTGRDALHRRFDPRVESYWQEHRPPRGLDRYFKQF